MEAIHGMMNNTGVMILGGLGAVLTSLAAVFGPKLVRSLVSREVGKLLAKALNPDTPDLKKKELIVTLVKDAARLAAYELPDEGLSPERKNALQAHLEKFIPSKQADVIAELLNDAIDELDDQLEAVNKPEAPEEP